MKFVHLHVHSHYSLLDGLAKIDEILKRVKELGMEAVALTDHGNLYGAIEFYKKAKKAGIKPIIGCEVYLAPNGRFNKRPKIDEKRFHLTLLAKNKTGWHNLIKLVTDANLEGFYYKPRIDKELLQKYSAGLICLSGCHSGEIAYLLLNDRFEEAEQTAEWYRSIFSKDFYLEIQPHIKELHLLFKELSRKLDIPLAATQDVHYTLKEDKLAHEILLAVQTTNRFDDESRLSFKEFDLSITSAEEMAEIFKEIPEAIENTIQISQKCDLEIELNKTLLLKFPLPSDQKSAHEYLNRLVYQKLPQRFPEPIFTLSSPKGQEIKNRLEYELGVIEKTKFADYFLIAQDFVNWAKEHGIVVGPGRGSAASSLVSYVLGITNVDPIKYNLFFERFLNPDRNQPPDIDIDFTDIRRDEVFAYIKDKYGNDRVAQIITFGKMLAKAAVRDVGRAVGLPYSFCDKIAKLIPFNMSIIEALETNNDLKQIYESDQKAKELIDSAKKLEGTARHASVHACGLVVAPEPLINFVPLQKAPRGDIIITQFEMHAVEDIGLMKFDLLGLKNLTIIEKTIRLVKEIYGQTIDINNLPLDDKKTFQLFQKGETTGVFQLESSGMRAYLKEMRPTDLENIITMIALYRPGPMELIPRYIRRKFKKEPVTYLHPKLEPILKKTYGIGIYQEQMMQIARDLGGFTLSEADILRRAIGKKIKGLLAEQKEKLINGMLKNGIDQKTASEIWELFPPFASYGFNRSHAASYAMISYQTAYLKAHYPVEFIASLLNISGTDVDRINFFINEAKALNIKVLPPDINLSLQDFTPQGENIRFGLGAIKNIGPNIVNFIIEERGRAGPFEDLTDFLKRVQHRDLNKKSLESLIKCGALDSLDIERGQALTNIEEIIRFNQNAKKNALSSQSSLFGALRAPYGAITLKPAEPADKKLKLQWEKELLGLYVTEHLFSAYLSKIKDNTKTIKDIKETAQEKKTAERGPRLKIAGIIAGIKQIFTKNGQPMLFVTLEDLSESIEIMVFNNTLEKTKQVWESNKAVMVSGRFSYRNDEPKFVCDEAQEL